MGLDIPLELYRIFCTVVRTGNMSQAAKQLFITQPAVSMSIRNLEDRLGKALLIRGPKGIRLTSEGGALYGSLSKALELIELAEQEYSAAVNPEAGELRLCAGDGLIARLLLGRLEGFMAEHPKISVRISVCGEAEEELKSGRFDIVFTGSPPEVAGIEALPFMPVNYCLLGGREYAGLTQIDAVSISSHALILPAAGGERRLLDGWARKHGAALIANIETDNDGLRLELARNNMGLVFAPREAVLRELQSGELFELPLQTASPVCTIFALNPKARRLSCAERKFMAFLNLRAKG